MIFCPFIEKTHYKISDSSKNNDNKKKKKIIYHGFVLIHIKLLF